MTTPNMNLTLPVVSTTPGPLWATSINQSLTTIDAHNHTSGNGALVPTAGLDINADLPFYGYNATFLNSTQFIDQDGALPSIVAGLYVSGADLWFMDGASVPVQITSGGSIVGAGGTINGLPYNTASVTFYPGSGTYTFIKATAEAAPMDVGPITVRRTSALSNGVTITPASGTTNWTLTLPAAAPVADSFATVSTAGALGYVSKTGGITSTMISSGTITGGNIASATIQTGNIVSSAITTSLINNGAVTLAKLAPANKIVTSSCGSYTVPVSVSGWSNVTNLSSLFTATAGRPIVIGLTGLNPATTTLPGPPNAPTLRLASGTVVYVYFEITGAITQDVGLSLLSSQAANYTYLPVSSISTVWVPATGGLLNIQVKATTYTGTSAILNDACLFAYQY